MYPASVQRRVEAVVTVHAALPQVPGEGLRQGVVGAGGALGGRPQRPVLPRGGPEPGALAPPRRGRVGIHRNHARKNGIPRIEACRCSVMVSLVVLNR